MSTATESGSLTGERSVVTVGTYDGVHLGHRRLIEETKRSARERACRSVVVTFSVHPSKVLRPSAPVPLLCTLEEKIDLLQETGIDEVVVLEFDRDRAHESAEDFVIRDLVGRLGAVEVVVGSNFRFGFKRHGDVALLHRLGEEYGFVTTGVDLVLDDEHHSVVSSTRIRALIANGAMREAQHLLGRPYPLIGMVDSSSVMHLPKELLIPPEGTYLVSLSAGGSARSHGVQSVRGTARITDRATVTLGDLVAGRGIDRERPVRVAFEGDREPAVEGDR
ncbi:MAG TPA: FAD synthetase family protein [Acidimicrobiales bacterium]|nr:FAD synthetase family protein [Acidimicrobiales bacterium]